MEWLLVFVLLSILLYDVYAYSSGAPDSACSSMSPSERMHGATPQSISTFPYAISVTQLREGNFTSKNTIMSY